MRRRLQYQQWFSPLSQDVGFVETVTLDKWWREASQPIFLPKPVLQGGSAAMPMRLVTIASFGWNALTSQPNFAAFALKNRPPNGSILFIPPAVPITSGITVLIDLVEDELR
jgi:hypothetical protein